MIAIKQGIMAAGATTFGKENIGNRVPKTNIITVRQNKIVNAGDNHLFVSFSLGFNSDKKKPPLLLCRFTSLAKYFAYLYS